MVYEAYDVKKKIIQIDNILETLKDNLCEQTNVLYIQDPHFMSNGRELDKYLDDFQNGRVDIYKTFWTIFIREILNEYPHIKRINILYSREEKEKKVNTFKNKELKILSYGYFNDIHNNNRKRTHLGKIHDRFILFYNMENSTVNKGFHIGSSLNSNDYQDILMTKIVESSILNSILTRYKERVNNLG